MVEYQAFPALLRSADGRVKEFGRGALAFGQNTVDFYSEFIPLMELGTEAQVVWLAGTRELAVFEGRIYLSSAERARLVNVDPAALRLPRAVLALNTCIAATIAPPGRPGAALPAELVYLAQGLVKLRTDARAERGQKLMLSAEVDFLTLEEVELEVEEQVLLDSRKTLLLCSVKPGSDANYIALKTYAAKLEARQRKEQEAGD